MAWAQHRKQKSQEGRDCPETPGEAGLGRGITSSGLCCRLSCDYAEALGAGAEFDLL